MFSRAYKTIVTAPPLVWVTRLPARALRADVLLQLLVGLSCAGDRPFLDSARTIRKCCRNRSTGKRCCAPCGLRRGSRCSLLLLGYPLAYFLSFYAGRRKDLLYQLVIIPLWVSYLVRAYAWKTILGSDGVLNTLLQYVHLTSHPVEFLLYSPFAVVLTLTHIYTPFTFLPIYAALEHIPRNLVEASMISGATPVKTFWKVILPLSIPGVVAGATFAFVLSLGDFLAPLLLGGPSGIMISNVVVSLFGAAYNWPLGAAISLGMLVIVVSLLFLSEKLEKRWSFS